MTLWHSIRNGLVAGLAALFVVGVGTFAADIFDNTYRETDASNSDATLFPEGMAPSAVNDNLRGTVGAIKRWYNLSQPVTASTGSANQYTVNVAVTPAEYATGMRLAFRANFANSASAQVRVNSLAYRSIVLGPGRDALQAGDILSGQHVVLSYDPSTGTFQMESPPRGGIHEDNIASTGSGGAYVLTYTSTPAAYVSGNHYRFRASFSLTGAGTLNVNGLGAKAIRTGSGSTALRADDIRSGEYVEVLYNGISDVFQLINPLGGGLPESGTWTPTIAGSGTAGTQTYSTQLGNYTRSANMAHVYAVIALSATDGAGNITVAGLPFTADNSGSASLGWTCSVFYYGGIALNSGYTQIGARVNQGAATINLNQSGSRVGTAAIDVNKMEATANLELMCTYRIS